MAQGNTGPNTESAPGHRYRDVTPSDTADLDFGPCRGINVSADCVLSIIGPNDGDDADVVVTLVKGTNPIGARRIRATGSTADIDIVAVY